MQIAIKINHYKNDNIMFLSSCIPNSFLLKVICNLKNIDQREDLVKKKLNETQLKIFSIQPKHPPPPSQPPNLIHVHCYEEVRYSYAVVFFLQVRHVDNLY